MKLRWTKRALKNLEMEAEHIGNDDADVAKKVVQRIHDLLALLVENPGMGRPGRIPGTRELVITGTRYLIPYKVKGQEIQILRVFHTSKKWPPA